MNKNKAWWIVNVIVTAVGAATGVASIFTNIMAAPYNEELTKRQIENKENDDEV